jgi:FAD:protein FMN transferase
MNKTITLLISLLLITACSTSEKAEQTKELMGTYVTITIYGEEEQTVEQATEAAYKEIERIEKLVSNYINTSEVYILNENQEIGNASNELIYLLTKSLKYGDISQGAFDVTVQPILDLYKDSFENLKRPPTEEEVQETLNQVGYEYIFIKNKNMKFTKPTKITLGGIAKGYAIDKAIEVLKQYDVEHALVNAGGDMRAIGAKGEEDWQIALQNPRDKKDHITIIHLNDKAVATSGDYERYYDDEKKFHHIVDPRTGFSATELISVTIVTDKAVDADALATSVFVLGKEDGLNLVENTKNTEALIITNDKEIIKSSGFDALTNI